MQGFEVDGRTTVACKIMRVHVFFLFMIDYTLLYFLLRELCLRLFRTTMFPVRYLLIFLRPHIDFFVEILVEPLVG